MTVLFIIVAYVIVALFLVKMLFGGTRDESRQLEEDVAAQQDALRRAELALYRQSRPRVLRADFNHRHDDGMPERDV